MCRVGGDVNLKILDLDMDYFMTEIAHTPYSCADRLDEESYGGAVWTIDAVRQFLEDNLGLSKNHKIPIQLCNV